MSSYLMRSDNQVGLIGSPLCGIIYVREAR